MAEKTQLDRTRLQNGEFCSGVPFQHFFMTNYLLIYYLRRISPKTLLVHLMRFRYDEEVVEKIDTKVRMTNTVSLQDHAYHLCGVLDHIGRHTGRGGHCTAIIKKDGQRWVHYDDAVGTRRSIDHITGSAHNQKLCYLAAYHM